MDKVAWTNPDIDLWDRHGAALAQLLDGMAGSGEGANEMSGDLELGRLVDPPDYTITITADDMAGILNIVEECLMRLDDFIDMDYGSYLREGTRQALELRRGDVRELLARLVAAQAAAERAAFASMEDDEEDM